MLQSMSGLMEIQAEEETKCLMSSIENIFDERAVKKASVVVSRSLSLPMLKFAFYHQRCIQRLILIDPEASVPSSMQGILAAIVQSDFQTDNCFESYLHQLQIPILILQSLDASNRQIKSCKFLKKRLPLSWLSKVENGFEDTRGFETERLKK